MLRWQLYEGGDDPTAAAGGDRRTTGRHEEEEEETAKTACSLALALVMKLQLALRPTDRQPLFALSFMWLQLGKKSERGKERDNAFIIHFS